MASPMTWSSANKNTEYGENIWIHVADVSCHLLATLLHTPVRYQ